jgi:alpha-beta hydrolase superfamily lysophospholipase
MEKSIKDIKTYDGLKLKSTIFNRNADSWVIVTHGVGEHRGRHNYWLSDDFKNYNVVLYDLRGHGESEGMRGDVRDFDDYLKDIDSVCDFLATECGMKKFYLFGHSMGGLITARWLQMRKNRALYPSKTILSAPGLGTVGVLGLITSSIPAIVYKKLTCLPSLPLGGMLDLTKLSHNPQVYKDYVSDPLNILKVHSHLYFDLLNKAKETFSKPLAPRTPLLVIMGSADGVVSTDLVKNYFDEFEPRAEFVLVKDAYHELYMETDEYFQQFIESINTFFV